MFLMLRAQKRLTITAGKITDLSLEGFTTVSKSYAGNTAASKNDLVCSIMKFQIMKSSASYISVLRALY